MERLTEILDRDLSEDEAVEIQKKLKIIMDRNDEPDLSQLAKGIQTYFDSDAKRLVQPDPTFIEKVTFSVQKFEEKHVSRRRLKTLIFIGLLIWAAWSLISPLGYLAATKDPAQLQILLDQLINQKLIYNQSGLTWFQARVLLEGSTGILAVIAAISVSPQT